MHGRSGGSGVHYFYAGGSPSFVGQLDSGKVKSVSINLSAQTVTVTPSSGAPYTIAYPDSKVLDAQLAQQPQVAVDVVTGASPWWSGLLPLLLIRGAHGRLHGLHDAPHAGRRLQGHELRQEPRQARQRRLAQGHVQGRGRRARRRSRSCTRSRSSSRTPRSSSSWARASPRACCCTARPAPARRCSRVPSPARRASRSSPSAVPTSSRCSSASAPRACATCSTRPSRTRRASSSSTRSTPSAVIAAPDSAAATTSASRRSTSCSSRWTASR